MKHKRVHTKYTKEWYRNIGMPKLHSCPCGKQCFVDELSARVVLIARHAILSDLNAYYQCDKSDYWHITSHGKTRSKKQQQQSHSKSIQEVLAYTEKI